MTRRFPASRYGAKPTTAVSFARRIEDQDHGVHETELRRPGLSGDFCRAGTRAAAEEEEKPEKTDHKEFEFNLLPRDIKAHLDRFVIKQDEAKKVLAIAVCDHYNHANYLRRLEKEDATRAQEIEYIKQNVILVGPTGVGKTYLIKHIADLIKVPFVKADATKFSETGYVGGDVEDLVRELVHKAERGRKPGAVRDHLYR